jgi:hypothetical protein
VEVLDRRVDRLRRNPEDLADVQVNAALAHLVVGDPDERDRERVEAVLAGARVARALGRQAAGQDDLINALSSQTPVRLMPALMLLTASASRPDLPNAHPDQSDATVPQGGCR